MLFNKHKKIFKYIVKKEKNNLINSKKKYNNELESRKFFKKIRFRKIALIRIKKYLTRIQK